MLQCHTQLQRRSSVKGDDLARDRLAIAHPTLAEMRETCEFVARDAG